MEILWSLAIGETVSDLLYLLMQRSIQGNVRQSSQLSLMGASMAGKKQVCIPEISWHFSGAAKFSHKVSLSQLPSSISGS